MQLAADPELSVKNGAELLDRLIKDIVAESASTYISVLQTNSPEESLVDATSDDSLPTYADEIPFPTAFSLPRFVPLLKERIYVINPFTRIFLVSWITLLDSIPDLELVTHLPAFLGGLFRFLSDPNQDVHIATQQALEGFLSEIKRIARVKRGVEESRKNRTVQRGHSRTLSDSGSTGTDEVSRQAEGMSLDDSRSNTETPADEKDEGADGSWIPGQDVEVDHQKLLEILIPFLDAPEEEIQLTALRWVDNFFEICPEDLLPFVPRLLSHVLPAIAHQTELVRQAAVKVNGSLLGLIALTDDSTTSIQASVSTSLARTTAKDDPPVIRRDSQVRQSLPKEVDVGRRTPTTVNATPRTASPLPAVSKGVNLDYSATVSALTLQFLNEHEQTRVVALEWLLMLHRNAPRKVLNRQPPRIT
jgi:vacuole morphology and inheritance protein 14